MFDTLIEKIGNVIKNLNNKGRLSEKDIDDSLRQIRLALLEADVNFKVVKDLLDKVKLRALSAQVLESLNPGQQIIKIVSEELTNILGKQSEKIDVSGQRLNIIMLVGLQGSGKTSTAAKLASMFKQSGNYPLLVAADTRRPAAIEQLKILSQQINVPIYLEPDVDSPVIVCRNALKKAGDIGATIIILDTQGRLHIDQELMHELKQIKNEVQPSEILLVVDAMTGQDAVKIADEFNKNLDLTGLILTKMDGDARGGAALSIRFITGIPIKYIGIGEKTDDLEAFHPDRMANRILGMGDVLTLIEKVEKNFDEQQARKLEKKIKNKDFNLDDFLMQLKQVKKLGSLSQIVEMLPGFPKMASNNFGDAGEKQLKKIEAIVLSMTRAERENPNIINGSRRKRIANGSGCSVKDVNQLLNQFVQVKKIANMAAKGKLPKNIFKSLR
jgi:signal recognition particle subunit SRP54